MSYVYYFYENDKLLGIFTDRDIFKHNIISYLTKKISPNLSSSSQFQSRYENNIKEFNKKKSTIINGINYSMEIKISNKIFEEKWITKYKKLNIKYKGMKEKQKLQEIKFT